MGWYQKLSSTAKAMFRAVVLVCGVFLVAGLAVTLFISPFEKPLAFGVGLALGGLSSICNIVMLERSLTGAGRSAGKGAGAQMAARYLLTAAVLLSAVFLRGYIGLFGVVAGVIALPFAAFIVAFRKW